MDFGREPQFIASPCVWQSRKFSSTHPDSLLTIRTDTAAVCCPEQLHQTIVRTLTADKKARTTTSRSRNGTPSATEACSMPCQQKKPISRVMEWTVHLLSQSTNARLPLTSQKNLPTILPLALFRLSFSVKVNTTTHHPEKNSPRKSPPQRTRHRCRKATHSRLRPPPDLRKQPRRS